MSARRQILTRAKSKSLQIFSEALQQYIRTNGPNLSSVTSNRMNAGLEYSPTQSKHSAKDKVSSEELRYLNSCVLNPFKLDEPREYNFCDCVHKMDIPDSMKARLIEMAGTPLFSRKPLFEWCAYRYFNIGRILDDARDLSADSLKERLCSHLLSSWKFEDDSSPESWGPIQYLFIQSMFNAHLNELRKRGTGIETTEKASALAEVSAVLSQTRPVI